MGAAKINFQNILEVVKQLSPDEKMILNDAIWDDSMPIPIEHQRIVLDRIEKAKTNPERLLNWDEVTKDWDK